MSTEKQADELPETMAPIQSFDAHSRRSRLTGTVGLTSLPEVTRLDNQVTLTPRNDIRYQNESVLGRGGMGEVRLAVDQDIGRRVAVKRMLDERNPQAVARFVDEVRTVGKLEHPNIVPIHDVGVDADGRLFFVMKYVDGETLASIIGKLADGNKEYHQRYTFEARLELFAGLLHALQYAHEHQMLHRDIKPENVMIGHFGEVMLMDWGISRFKQRKSVEQPEPALQEDGSNAEISSRTLEGAIIGTPRYMSPEQASGGQIDLDERSDLYSAFIVLYELLTTQSYIKSATNSAQAVMEALHRQPPPITDPNFDRPHQAAVPAELRHFLRRGLALRKEDRFPDAGTVLHQLEKIRSGEPDVQCPITFVKAANARAERLMDRHPIVAALAFFVIILATFSGIFSWATWLLAS